MNQNQEYKKQKDIVPGNNETSAIGDVNDPNNSPPSTLILSELDNFLQEISEASALHLQVKSRSSSDDDMANELRRLGAAEENLRKELERSNKIQQIESCISSNGVVDLWELRTLALTKGGFVNKEIRQTVWPILTGVDVENQLGQINQHSIVQESVKRDVDAAALEIIRRDVGRTVWRLLEEDQDQQQLLLVNIICSVLVNSSHQSADDKLHYYQGFHDVCSLVHINLPSSFSASNSAAVISQLCMRHFRDAMQINFSRFLRGVQLAFWPLLSQVDPTIEAFLFECHYGSSVDEGENGVYCADKLETPVSIVSWTMTWFASQLGNHEQFASCLMDAFMASHALMPVYVAVAFLCRNRDEVLSCECDFASIHMLLVHLPRTTIEDASVTEDELCQNILDAALKFMRRVPPWRLVQLAKTYRRGMLSRSSKPNVKLIDHSDISMFGSPTPWSIKSKHYLKEKQKLFNGNNKKKKAKKISTVPLTNFITKNKQNEIKEYKETANSGKSSVEPQMSLAWVASGCCEISSWRLILPTQRRWKMTTTLILICGLLFISTIFLFRKEMPPTLHHLYTSLETCVVGISSSYLLLALPHQQWPRFLLSRKIREHNRGDHDIEETHNTIETKICSNTDILFEEKQCEEKYVELQPRDARKNTCILVPDQLEVSQKLISSLSNPITATAETGTNQKNLHSLCIDKKDEIFFQKQDTCQMIAAITNTDIPFEEKQSEEKYVEQQPRDARKNTCILVPDQLEVSQKLISSLSNPITATAETGTNQKNLHSLCIDKKDEIFFQKQDTCQMIAAITNTDIPFAKKQSGKKYVEQQPCDARKDTSFLVPDQLEGSQQQTSSFSNPITAAAETGKNQENLHGVCIDKRDEILFLKQDVCQMIAAITVGSNQQVEKKSPTAAKMASIRTATIDGQMNHHLVPEEGAVTTTIITDIDGQMNQRIGPEEGAVATIITAIDVEGHQQRQQQRKSDIDEVVRSEQISLTEVELLDETLFLPAEQKISDEKNQEKHRMTYRRNSRTEFFLLI